MRLLGSVAVVRDGVEERLSLERPISLLAYLAVRGVWVNRVELAFLYRPDVPEAQALTYLRKLVFRARAYPWASGLEVDGDALRWSVPTDVARFREAVTAGDWAAALAEYSRPFLGGAVLSGAPGFTEWQEVERAALESAWLRVAEQRAGELEREARFAEAIALHRAVLERDPFAEASVQALVRLLDAGGRRLDALAVYESFRLELANELGAEPLESTEVLADGLRRAPDANVGLDAGVGRDAHVARFAVAAGDAAAQPLDRGARSRIPASGTRFVGRREELATVAGLLERRDVRLVTIVGLGGSGKTRLALEAAGASASSMSLPHDPVGPR